MLLKKKKLMDYVDAMTHEKNAPLFFGFKAGMLLKTKEGKIQIFMALQDVIDKEGVICVFPRC